MSRPTQSSSPKNIGRAVIVLDGNQSVQFFQCNLPEHSPADIQQNEDWVLVDESLSDTTVTRWYEQQFGPSIEEEFQEFVYAVSHDLKAPLRNIEKFAEVLLKRTEGLETRQVKSLEFIQSGVGLMKRQLDGILEYSRVQSQAAPMQEVALHEVVKRYLQNNSIKIEKETAGVLLKGQGIVWGDEKQLYQWFQKVIENAMQFGGAEKAIEVHIIESDSEVKMTIRDYGLGFSEERIPRICNLFFKFHHDLDLPGLGVGLAVAKRIADRHQAGMIFENASEGGAMVHLIFNKKA